ncbi:hypothetical protein CCP3SC15_420017 [Gammaproteobacteria bacterium]
MAALSEGVFFSNQGTLTIAGTGGTPSAYTINAIQNVKIEPHFDIAKAYGWNTVFRIGAAQHTFEVDVSIEWIKWDPTVASWIGAYWMNASAGGTVADTTIPVTFTVVTKFTSSTGVIMNLTVSNVVFKNMPIDAKLGEWVRVNLEGTGSTMTITNA